MATGYWMGHVRITDPERYKDYVAANGKAFAKFNGRFLVRGGDSEVREGDQPYQRHVVIEFDSFEIAKQCYDSPEYQEALAIRLEASEGYMTIVEGYEG